MGMSDEIKELKSRVDEIEKVLEQNLITLEAHQSLIERKLLEQSDGWIGKCAEIKAERDRYREALEKILQTLEAHKGTEKYNVVLQFLTPDIKKTLEGGKGWDKNHHYKIR